MTDLIPQQTSLQEETTRQALIDLAVGGMHRGALSPALEELVAAGYALAKGPLVMPTPTGTALAGELCRVQPGSDEERRIRALFEVFLPINRQVRDVCTAWQTRPGGMQNDHTDAAYDAKVRDQLDDVDTAIRKVLRRLSQCDSRFEHYAAHLTAALEKLDAGDGSWLASPLKDSYHTVWMRLHQELLLVLGISRSEDEALEEQLVSGRTG